MKLSKGPTFPCAYEKQPVWARSSFFCSFLGGNPFQKVLQGWPPVEPKPHAHTKTFHRRQMAHSLGSQVFGEKDVFLPNILSKDILQMCSFVEIPEKLSTVQSVSLEFCIMETAFGCKEQTKSADIEKGVIISQNKESGVRIVIGNSVAQQSPRIQMFSLCPLCLHKGIVEFYQQKSTAVAPKISFRQCHIQKRKHFLMYIVLLARNLFSGNPLAQFPSGSIGQEGVTY